MAKIKNKSWKKPKKSQRNENKIIITLARRKPKSSCNRLHKRMLTRKNWEGGSTRRKSEENEEENGSGVFCKDQKSSGEENCSINKQVQVNKSASLLDLAQFGTVSTSPSPSTSSIERPKQRRRGALHFYAFWYNFRLYKQKYWQQKQQQSFC